MIKNFTNFSPISTTKLSAILALVCFLFSTQFSVAQSKDKNNAKGNDAKENINMKKVSNEAPKLSQDELKVKFNNIDADPSYTLDEKNKIKEEILQNSGFKSYTPTAMSFDQISFKPKYIPVSQFENWKNYALAKYPNANKNIVALNEEVFLDFNNYYNREFELKMSEMAYNSIDENFALKYLVPSLSAQSKLLPEGSSLKNSLKLYYAYQPEIFNLLPKSISSLMNDDKGIEMLIKMQGSASR